MLTDDKKLFEHITHEQTKKTICRSCLQESKSKMKNLGTVLTLDSFLFNLIPHEINVIGLYNYCSKQPVMMNDGLAQNVCTPCLKKFISTYEFLKQCDLAESRLRELAAASEPKIEVYVQDNCYEEILTLKEEENDEAHVIQPQDLNNESMIIERLYESSEEQFFADIIEENSENSSDVDTSALISKGILRVEPQTQELGKKETLDTLTCPVCAKQISHKHYKTHFARSHPGYTKKYYECKKCNTQLSSFYNYNKHLNSNMHRGIPKPQPKFSQHKRAPCTVCGKVFTEYYLQKHMVCHNTTKPFKCEVKGCDTSYYLKSSLGKHKSIVHPPKSTADGKNEVKLLCPHCGKILLGRLQLSRHLRTHEINRKRVDCDICGKSVTAKDKASHMRVHTGERPYKCGICGKAFGQNSTMRTHERQHGQRPHPCKMCDKAFARASQLSVHLRVHTGEQPFFCDVCSRSFTRIDQLVSHQRVEHGTVGPHQCKICQKRYHRKESLKQHRFYHLGKSCKCPICSSAYTYPNQLKKHLRTKHNINSRDEAKTYEEEDQLVKFSPSRNTEEADQELVIQMLDYGENEIEVE